MGRLTTFICCALFLCSGCLNTRQETLEKKVIALETQLEQKERELEGYKGVMARIEELDKLSQSVSKSCFQVLENLERLDKNIYESKYVGHLRLKSAKSEDVVDGYLALIDQMERDLGCQEYGR